MRVTIALPTLAVMFVVAPHVAWGQASASAEALFRDGKQLMKQGKLAEACTAFEGSQRTEPNVSTLMNLADCREKNHQYATAWALFLQVESQTRTDNPTRDRSKAALQRAAKDKAAALEGKLAFLTINVPDESRVPELVVLRDGAPVDPAEWNRAIPADVGAHVVSGKAPGHESWSTTVTLRADGDKQAVEVPRFKALPEIVNRPVRAVAVADDEAESAQAPAEPSPFTRRRRIALGVAAGGVVAAGVALGLGISAQHLRDEALSTCPETACSATGAARAQDQNDRARSRALFANVGFGVAGAAVVAGAVLWFTGAPASRSIALVPAGNGAALVGSF